MRNAPIFMENVVMNNKLPLKQSLERLSLNEEKFEKVVNGGEEESVELGGKYTPTLRNLFSKLTSAAFLEEIVQRATSCAKYWALQANKIATTEAFIATGTTEARTLPERAADVINVKDFGAKGDGVTDDTEAIQRAVYSAKQKSARLYWPEGVYVKRELTSINDFLGVFHVGDGKIKIIDSLYIISNHEFHENHLYCSPNGSGDGLSNNTPSTIDTVIAYLKLHGEMTGPLTVHMNDGIHVFSGILSGIVNKYWYLSFVGNDPDINGELNTKFETHNDNIITFCIYDVGRIKFKNIWFDNTSGATSGTDSCLALVYSQYPVWVKRCKFTNARFAGINCNFNSRILVENCEFYDCGYGIEVYNSTAAVGYNGSSLENRCKIVRCSTGVHVQHGYSHTDYTDFKNCAHGIVCDYQGFSGNINNTFEDVNLNFVVSQGSAFSDRANSNTTSGYARMSPIISFNDDGSSDGKNFFMNYYPFLGDNGRLAIGYKKNSPPFAPLQISNGNTKTNGVQASGSTLGIHTDKNNYIALISEKDGAIQGIRCFDPSGATGSIRVASGEVAFLLQDVFSYVLNSSHFSSYQDNTKKLGNSSHRWETVYAGTGNINTSDIREKQRIESFSDDVLDAWGDIQFRQFMFNDAIEKKGDTARIHCGIVAQQVMDVFAAHGLDATRYGLFCYDEWDDQYENVEIEDSPSVIDENGNEVTPAQKHTEKKLVIPRGNRYGIRYSEALCLEVAYQRRRAERIEARLEALEARLEAGA